MRPGISQEIEKASTREASKEALKQLQEFEKNPEAFGENMEPLVEEPKTENIEPEVETAKTSDPETEQVKDTDTKTEPTTEQETVSEMTSEERIGLLEKELKLRDLQDEKRSLQVTKWQTLAQTRAGEVNHLRKSGPNRTQDESVDYNALLAELQTDEPATESDTRDNSRLALLEQESADRAKQDTLLRFYQENKIEDDMATRIAKIIPDIVSDYELELASNSVKKVTKATTNLLKEAMITVKEQDMLSEIEEARKRRVAVTENARKRKIASASSTSSSSSGTNLTTNDLANTNIESMSADDLRKLLQAEDKRSRR